MSLLHGNSITFYKQEQLREDLFRRVFEYWNHFSMTQKSLARIHESSDILQHWIEELSQRNSNVSSDADPSPCSKVLNIGSIITRKLSTTLSNMKIKHNGYPLYSNNHQ